VILRRDAPRARRIRISRPRAAPPPLATDLALTKAGPGLFLEDQEFFYNPEVRNLGPAAEVGTK
jgi:hypothetical protein